MDTLTKTVTDQFGKIKAESIKSKTLRTQSLTVEASGTSTAMTVIGGINFQGSINLKSDRVVIGTKNGVLGFYGQESTIRPTIAAIDLAIGVPAPYTQAEKINDIIFGLKKLGLFE